jgi:hypothetical protein
VEPAVQANVVRYVENPLHAGISTPVAARAQYAAGTGADGAH